MICKMLSNFSTVNESFWILNWKNGYLRWISRCSTMDNHPIYSVANSKIIKYAEIDILDTTQCGG